MELFCIVNIGNWCLGDKFKKKTVNLQFLDTSVFLQEQLGQTEEIVVLPSGRISKKLDQSAVV